jgi:MYXO-CTERM domain-containing protein
MLVSRHAPASLAALLSGALSLLSGLANAGQSCNADADCDHGFACEVVGGSVCAGIACPPDAPCPPQPACDPQVIKECVPGPCKAHSDCADGMVCYAFPTPDCVAEPTPACPPGVKCDDAPPPPACTETNVNKCVPLWSLPCATDASCGDGFSCVQDPDSCECSGSAGGPAPGNGTGSFPGSAQDGGSAKPVPPGTPIPPTPVPDPAGPTPPSGECSCTPATTKHCTPKATTCTVDSDCPSTWTCASSGGATCSGGGAVLPDGGVTSFFEGCGPTSTTKQCQAPSYGGYGLGISEPGSGTAGSESTPPRASGTTGSAGSPGSDPSSPATGVAGASSHDGTTANSDDKGATDSSKPSGSDDSGCQIGHGGGSGNAGNAGASVLAMLGVAGLIRRRRTRWG